MCDAQESCFKNLKFSNIKLGANQWFIVTTSVAAAVIIQVTTITPLELRFHVRYTLLDKVASYRFPSLEEQISEHFGPRVESDEAILGCLSHPEEGIRS